jgi:uncharacterized protein YjlB
MKEYPLMSDEKILSDFKAWSQGVVQTCLVIQRVIKGDGIFPNNGKLPLLVYPGAVNLPNRDPAAVFEDLFSENSWGHSWRNGIYNFHHYHSLAHEVLGIFSGTARVQLGGEAGMTQTVNPGDVIIIPAGVSHKNLGGSPDFGVVGAYPEGQAPDLCSGKKSERPKADQNISRLPLPPKDPVYGREGPLINRWY